MRKPFSWMILALLLLSIVTSVFEIQLAKSEPTVIVVPDDYPSIQGAIDAASPGCNIFVRQGVYYEHVIVWKSYLSIVGENRETTIIDGSGTGPVLKIGAESATDYVNVTGFTLRNATNWGFGTGAGLAISGRSTAHVNVYGNIMNENFYGILPSSGSLLSDNLIENNQYGIMMDVPGVYNAKVSGNTLINNICGIYIDVSCYNLFYHNNINNGVAISGEEHYGNYHNRWDNEYPSGGNYWSDYTGVDQKSGPNQDQPGSDGIGDTPYIINSNNKDNYPLMQPWSSTPPDFEISVSPDTQIAQSDSSVNYQITITSKNDFSSSVTLDASFSPLPDHIGWTLDPAEVTPTPNGQATATLRINLYADTLPNVYTIAITATSGGIAKGPFYVKLEIKKILDVPYQNQGDTGWCGPTSLAMVLRYYGINFHSWDYTDPTTDLPLPSWGGLLDVSAIENYILKKYSWLTPVEGAYSSTDQARDRILYDIVSNITAGYPVILKLNKPFKGHYIVVAGYNGTGIFINDPSGATFSSDYLDLPSVTEFDHAFLTWANWEQLKQFIHPLNIPGADFVSVQYNNPEPTSATAYFTNLIGERIEFRDPSNSYNYHYVDLDFGLMWKPISPITPEYSTFEAWMWVSNTGSSQASFTLGTTIIGEDGSQSPLPDSTPISVQGYHEELRSIQKTNLVLEKTQYYHILFILWDSNRHLVDSFVTPDFYYLNLGTEFSLVEPGHHLYLHVYDAQGNHVGLNYTTNQTDLEIPGAYYHDDSNGTIIIVLPQITNLKIVVDATYAEEPVEPYNLTVTSETENGSSIQTYQGSIAQGTATYYLIVQSSGGGGGHMPYMN